MSSSTTSTKSPSGYLNRRVSLESSAAAASSNGTNPRKRKQDDEVEEPPVVLVGVPSNDKDEIKSIITKRLWSDDSDDVAEALKSLYQLVRPSHVNKVENQTYAFHLGATLAIVKAMIRNSNHPEIQADACFDLGAIAKCGLAEAGHIIIDNGGMTRCLLAMEQHHNQPRVMAGGCNLIGNLWRNPNLQQNVVDAGGLKAVINAMKNNKPESNVQVQGCYALYNLVHTTLFAKAVVDANGIEAVIAAMEKYPNQANLQKLACQFLHALAIKEDYRKTIISAKGLVAVAQARQVHHDNNEVLREAEKAIKAIIP